MKPQSDILDKIRNPVRRLVFIGFHPQLTADWGKYQGHFSAVPHSAAPFGKPSVRWCQKSGHWGQIPGCMSWIWQV
jgi:hypothetical protein